MRGRCLIACREYVQRSIEVAAGIEHSINLGAVIRPLLDLVIVEIVRTATSETAPALSGL
jgi:hypothetical protein